MSMFKAGAAFSAAVCLALLASAQARAAEGPNLGRTASPEEVARMDLTIAPDGENLPPGAGSVAMGAAVYQEKCLACHGENGRDGSMGALAGGLGTLATGNPVRTVNSYWPYATTVFDYIRRAMPLNAPQSLTNEEVYAVTAYILSLDGVVPADAVLDARNLPQVRMPNRDGFINWEPNLLR